MNVGKLGIFFLFLLTGCFHETTVQRQKRLEGYPRISSRIASLLLDDALDIFSRNAEVLGPDSNNAYQKIWQKMIEDIQPLLVSLESYSLLRFQKTIEETKKRSIQQYSLLQYRPKAQIQSMMVFASEKIAYERKKALDAHRDAVRSFQEAASKLGESEGVPFGELVGTSPPRQSVKKAAKQRYRKLRFSYPTKKYNVSSHYGWRKHPILNQWRFHTGIDFAGLRGRLVYASAQGVVLRAGWMGGCGKGILLLHRHQLYRRVTTTYCHLSRVYIQEKQRVKQGQRIGRIGSTGRSTGPHLHFGLHINDKHVNPLLYLLKR